MVRNLLVQKVVGEKRTNWVTALEEYDIEIKPASIVEGQGFCKMLAGASRISEIPSTEIQMYEELHDGPIGGHYAGDATAHKILHAGYYWPTLFKDAHSYVRKCQVCQTVSRRQKKPTLPLQLVNIEQHFDQWGLDITGEIIPHSSKQHRYILIATNYFTKWVEAVPLKTANAEHIIDFID
eukprot:PITA_07159